MAVAMPAAATAAAAVSRRRIAAAGTGCREDGKFLGQFRRAAMRADRALPIRRADEDFAVAPALLAMEFVDRHEEKIAFCGGRTSGNKFNRINISAELISRRFGKMHEQQLISPFLSTASN